MDSAKIQECFAKMNKHSSIDQKLRLVYQWVKDSHINLAEFQFLLTDLAMDMINKAASAK